MAVLQRRLGTLTPGAAVPNFSVTSDGTHSIALGAATGLPVLNTPVAIEAIVKSTNFSSQQWIAQYGNGILNNASRVFKISDATTLGMAWDSSGPASITIPFTLNDGNPHHIVFLYDGTNFGGYVDGVSCGTAAAGPTSTAIGGDEPSLAVGSNESNAAAFLVGSAAFLAYYSTLTPTRIAAHFAAAQNSAASFINAQQVDAPIRYFKMQESSGTVCTDTGSAPLNITFGTTGITLHQTGLLPL